MRHSGLDLLMTALWVSKPWVYGCLYQALSVSSVDDYTIDLTPVLVFVWFTGVLAVVPPAGSEDSYVHNNRYNVLHILHVMLPVIVSCAVYSEKITCIKG